MFQQWHEEPVLYFIEIENLYIITYIKQDPLFVMIKSFSQY